MGKKMTSDTRRFYTCLLATTIAAVLLLPLAGLLWPRGDVFAATHHAGIKLLTLVLPPVRAARPKARIRPVMKAQPKRQVVKPRKPGARTRVYVPAAPSSAPPMPASTHTVVVPGKPRLAEAVKPKLTLPPAALQVPSVQTPTLPVSVPQATSPKPEVMAPAGARADTRAGSAPGSTDGGGGAGKGEASGSGGRAAGSGQGAGGEPFGVGAGMGGLGGPRHVVYVLDISGSMTSRIDRAREELRRTLTGLGPDETFDIVTFSDRATPFSANLTPASANSVAQANHFLGSVQVDGGTNLEAAMREALGLANVNEVVLLTDGVPTLGETDFGKLAGEIQKLNKNHARISAVGLLGRNPDGTDDSFEAEGLLRQITRRSGGTSEIVRLGTKSP